MLQNIVKCRCCVVKESGRVILNSHPESHKNLITSRDAFLARAFHVWSTSIYAFVSYLADSQTSHRHTDAHD